MALPSRVTAVHTMLCFVWMSTGRAGLWGYSTATVWQILYTCKVINYSVECLNSGKLCYQHCITLLSERIFLWLKVSLVLLGSSLARGLCILSPIWFSNSGSLNPVAGIGGLWQNKSWHLRCRKPRFKARPVECMPCLANPEDSNCLTIMGIYVTCYPQKIY